MYLKFLTCLLLVLLLPTAMQAQYEQCIEAKPQTFDDIAYTEGYAHKPFLAPQYVATNVGSNYDLKYHRFRLNIDPRNYFIEGVVTSYFKMVAPSQQITFDLIDALRVDSCTYHGYRLYVERPSPHIIVINLPDTLREGRLDSLSVYYHGTPESNGFGSFQTTHHDTAPIIWTLSEPYGAKEWWPCKQDLNDKIDSIDMYIVTPPQFRAAGNGVLVSETLISPEQKVYHWKHRYPIAAYLIATAVTNYAVYSDFAKMPDGSNLEILNYVYPQDSVTAREQTIDVVPTMELFSKILEPYPFRKEKYGHAQFGWGGGMEHQTMSFMGGFGRYLMAHELAHQWFGDKITCGSWRDIWLNEGFASYCEGLATEAREPERFTDWKRLRIEHITAEPDGSVFVYDTINVSRVFNGRLTYDKGAMVLNMLRYKLGDSTFFHGLRNYLKGSEVAYKYTSTPIFQGYMQRESNLDLTDFFDTWIYGEGYPIYDFSWEQQADTIRITTNQISSVGNRFFQLPLPLIAVNENGEKYPFVFQNTINGQIFDDIVPFKVVQLLFDPRFELIAKSNLARISGIEKYDSHLDLVVFPNPARDKITIRLLDTDNSIRTVHIHDILGREVAIYDDARGMIEYEISTDVMGKGTFFFFIDTDKGNRTEKIIVTR